MKKKIVYLLILCLSIFSNIAVATDWQYIGEGANPYGNFNAYIDKDTIIKSGDTITFWEMTRFYKLSDVPFLRADRPRKWMQKFKLLTQSQEYIIIENNSYDSNDKEAFHQKYGDNGLAPISVAVASPLEKKEFDFVIQNAKESTVSDEKPDPSYKTENKNDKILELTNFITNNPLDAVSYLKRGIAYLDQREYELAIKDVNRAIELNEKYAAAYFIRGVCYSRTANYNLAINDYTQAINLDPTYDFPYLNRGMMYNKIGKYDLAISDFDKALELDPKHAQTYYNKGLAFENKGLYQDAINTYKQLINQALESDAGFVTLAKDRIRQLGGSI